jgi:hypothetical protein
MGRGKPPAGFDALRLRAAAASLARKRARAVAKAWPGMSQALAQRFGELFAAYSQAATLPSEGGPIADGRAFARWLAARGELPEKARLQVMAVDLLYTATQAGLVRRRGPTCSVAWLHQSRRLIVALLLPWLGEYWLNIPLGRR